MSLFFVDSSALVKRYLTETGSTWINNLLDPASGNTIIVATITQVESAAALAARYRSGSITLTERDDLVDLLALHFDTEYQQIAIEEPILGRAVALTQNHSLRGYDAVQLAAALIVADSLPGLILLSADNAMNTAASAEGLATENPNDHP